MSVPPCFGRGGAWSIYGLQGDESTQAVTRQCVPKATGVSEDASEKRTSPAISLQKAVPASGSETSRRCSFITWASRALTGVVNVDEPEMLKGKAVALDRIILDFFLPR